MLNSLITKFDEVNREFCLMKLIVDQNIALASEAFNEFGSVQLVEGRQISNKLLKDADVLIVRSITDVNESLLKNTPVKFVGTATIGTDHIDSDYLSQNNITFADAKGCNADSVAEYVFTALIKIATSEKTDLSKQTIGVVGIGNIGSRVSRLADELGMQVLKNDPPKEREGVENNFVNLDEILTADIITLHVPLNKKGKDKTAHLLNEKNLKKIKEGTIIINTSRGEVIDNQALLSKTKTKNFRLILDVWEKEPDINLELLKETQIGTPHIAGYSLEGKINGTSMIFNALCSHLKKKPAWQPLLPKVEQRELIFPKGKTIEERLLNLFLSVYNIEKDIEGLRNILHLNTKNLRKEYFDLLRKVYPPRREFSNYTIKLSERDLALVPILEAFRFKVLT